MTTMKIVEILSVAVESFTVENITVVILLATMGVLIWQTRALLSSIQASTYNQIVDQNLRVNELLLKEPELLPEFWGEKDAARTLLAHSIIDHYENVTVQHSIKNLPETVWPGWKEYIPTSIWRIPALREAYLNMREHMDRIFTDLVDERGPADPTDAKTK